MEDQKESYKRCWIKHFRSWSRLVLFSPWFFLRLFCYFPHVLPCSPVGSHLAHPGTPYLELGLQVAWPSGTEVLWTSNVISDYNVTRMTDTPGGAADSGFWLREPRSPTWNMRGHEVSTSCSQHHQPLARLYAPGAKRGLRWFCFSSTPSTVPLIPRVMVS